VNPLVYLLGLAIPASRGSIVDAHRFRSPCEGEAATEWDPNRRRHADGPPAPVLGQGLPDAQDVSLRGEVGDAGRLARRALLDLGRRRVVGMVVLNSTR
jgi:hypothetical protein